VLTATCALLGGKQPLKQTDKKLMGEAPVEAAVPPPTLAAATASGPCASLYSLGADSTSPLAASSSKAVALVPSIASDATRPRAASGRDASSPNRTLQQGGSRPKQGSLAMLPQRQARVGRGSHPQPTTAAPLPLNPRGCRSRPRRLHASVWLRSRTFPMQQPSLPRHLRRIRSWPL
jgi:hypothetical protein